MYISRKNGKLPSGENISDIVKKYKEENWLGIIAACVHPESYEIIIKELKNSDISYGFKLNAFKIFLTIMEYLQLRFGVKVEIPLKSWGKERTLLKVNFTNL